MEEYIKAAWLLYYNDESSILDAKASVALDGMVARPCIDTKIASKDPDCFEVGIGCMLLTDCVMQSL